MSFDVPRVCILYPIVVPFYFSNLDLVSCPRQPSRLDETGQWEGCSPATGMQTGPPAYADWPAARCQENMQGMKFSGLFNLLYSGRAFHKTYI